MPINNHGSKRYNDMRRKIKYMKMFFFNKLWDAPKVLLKGIC